MRYFYTKPQIVIPQKYGITYKCNHPFYSSCTLYLDHEKGLSIIQERFNLETKSKYYSEIDSWLANDIYLNPGFRKVFLELAKEPTNGLYPTITVRQVMWKLRMKPLKKEWWEFDPFAKITTP